MTRRTKESEARFCLLCRQAVAAGEKGALILLGQALCPHCVQRILQTRPEEEHYDTLVRSLRPLGEAIWARAG